MGILGIIAGGVLLGMLEKSCGDITDMTISTLTETIGSILSGKRTFNELAELVSPNVDEVIRETKKNENLIFVGGKVKFCFYDSSHSKVTIGYELYFANEKRQWKKIEASSDVFSSIFKDEEIELLKESAEVAFEVTDVD